MSANKDHNTAQLLVEGNDDFHVVHALFNKNNVPVNNRENPNRKFSVKDCKGIESLLEVLPILLKILERVGIIIDADTEISNRWSQVRNILITAGFSVPQTLNREGVIIENAGIRIGIWLMPNNSDNGMLEDFMRFLISDDDTLLPHAERILSEIEALSENKYGIIHRSKALIHTWLAWQEDPGSPLGQAITKRYLAIENKEIAEKFIEWINNLFVR